MKKILVANRGEIALRVMRTAREMGIQTVAIYSEADRKAPHVRYADQAFCVGKAPSNQSYLNGDKIIEICRQNHVDAIHPGYGFLSENAAFAEKVKAAGITFIGPSPQAMQIMGDKLSAKAAVKKYDIPMIPGTDQAIREIDEGKKIAAQIGYPVLIKASAGGGGKGMRIVERQEDFQEQMQRAISEAESAFGNGAVFIERYLTSPRHVEIQVMADMHGNFAYLFERECSVQRRHQKVIEEAPCAVLTPELRAEMGKAAINVARSCNYVGAGTVEFLLDSQKRFYFLEMNTRLQVEHPVTEMITGIDLVKEQITVARGEKLSFAQSDLQIGGHAIEVRVYAEDPVNNFLPDIGTLKTYLPPKGAGVRLDDGYDDGMEIPIFYDPMIAKLVVHAKDRQTAIRRAIRAIDEYNISGIETTLPFCRFVLEHDAFVSGNYDTHFVKNYFSPEKLRSRNQNAPIAALVAAKLLASKQNKDGAPALPQGSPAQGQTEWKRRRKNW